MWMWNQKKVLGSLVHCTVTIQHINITVEISNR